MRQRQASSIRWGSFVKNAFCPEYVGNLEFSAAVYLIINLRIIFVYEDYQQRLLSHDFNAL